MKLLNAKLDISQVELISSTKWRITCVLIDNTGVFIASDILVKDVVYGWAINESMEQSVCRYRVDKIVSASGVNCVLEVTWDEPNTTYAELVAGSDCIVGRVLPNGATAITGPSNGVGTDILELARNIDMQLAKFAYDMTPTVITSLVGVVTLPLESSSHFFVVNGLEDVNKITGWTTGQFSIMWNYSRNLSYIPGVIEPQSNVPRQVSQGEITTWVFYNGCAKELCAPGGATPLDGGVV